MRLISIFITSIQFSQSEGVEKLEINVYDTPGFHDSKQSDLKSNNMKIVQQLDSDIHVFLLLLRNPNERLSADKQDIFENFHVWTKGNEFNDPKNLHLTCHI